MKDPIALVRKNIRELSPYSTARDEYDGPLGVYLDANESPYDNNYNRYPDPHQRRLKARLSQLKNVPANQIFVGNGSDEAIDILFRVFCEPAKDNAIVIAPSYGMYKVAAAVNGVEMREVPLREDFSLDVKALLSVADTHSKLLFLCSPNNPSGNSFPARAIEQLLREFNGIVALDEAYIDFSSTAGWLSRLADFPNLVVLQTLSKAWGMAGLRLGMAFAREDIISIFSQVKYPYNINAITQQLILQQLAQPVETQVAEIINQRQWVEKQLKEISLVKQVFPSDANFLLVRVENPRQVYSGLIRQGVIVRDRSNVPGCRDCLRITVGTPEENRRMLEALRKS